MTRIEQAFQNVNRIGFLPDDKVNEQKTEIAQHPDFAFAPLI